MSWLFNTEPAGVLIRIVPSPSTRIPALNTTSPPSAITSTVFANDVFVEISLSSTTPEPTPAAYTATEPVVAVIPLPWITTLPSRVDISVLSVLPWFTRSMIRSPLFNNWIEPDVRLDTLIEATFTSMVSPAPIPEAAVRIRSAFAASISSRPSPESIICPAVAVMVKSPMYEVDNLPSVTSSAAITVTFPEPAFTMVWSSIVIAPAAVIVSAPFAEVISAVSDKVKSPWAIKLMAPVPETIAPVKDIVPVVDSSAKVASVAKFNEAATVMLPVDEISIALPPFATRSMISVPVLSMSTAPAASMLRRSVFTLPVTKPPEVIVIDTTAASSAEIMVTVPVALMTTLPAVPLKSLITTSPSTFSSTSPPVIAKLEMVRLPVCVMVRSPEPVMSALKLDTSDVTATLSLEVTDKLFAVILPPSAIPPFVDIKLTEPVEPTFNASTITRSFWAPSWITSPVFAGKATTDKAPVASRAKLPGRRAGRIRT